MKKALQKNDLIWEKIKTKHGYSADEVISTLQKAIRRGEEEIVIFFAYELLISGEELIDKFWQRMVVISVEDVGMANMQLISAIHALHEDFVYLGEKPDRLLHGLMAALLLARSPKSRYADELINNLKAKIEEEKYRLEIPEYAFDKHTKKGRMANKGDIHFWTEGTKLINDQSKHEKQHLRELLKRLKKKKQN